MRLSRLRGENNEGLLAGLIILLVLMMGVVEPGFLGPATLTNVVRSLLVDLTFALGMLVVIISGGIDVSFTAIAIFSGYGVIVLMNDLGADGTVWPFALAALAGAVLGGLNAAMVAGLRLPTLIVTLGTQGIVRGALIAFVGSQYLSNLPTGLESLARSDLFAVTTGGGTARMTLLALPVAVLCVLVALLLRSTMLGRSIYAIGGDVESARRVGIRVGRVQTFVYLFAGALAGFGGLMHVTLSRQANPYDLVGSELDVIAAVVIGGASIFGGRGSVLGTVLGVTLIAVINNSLVLLGVPSAWQRLAVGLLVLLGVGLQALGQGRRKSPPILAEVRS
ncbi:ABC transporter permease [Spongiactinospora gelatinilytica]|uniref:ABC transporter permease n=1 Tax=Spongiactinospora gelatinilytica TaxID=2666298 RepID=A0A2W2H4K4_9ACTN|nr:ABC transporter permease [Spongiactinospora gelatinilytica]PZG55551.1 ABC transporter permease [Spongiactinospora gelatinilytica]